MIFERGNSRARKVSPAQVLEIRKRYDGGLATQGSLAREFGVSVVQIGRIVRREVWNSLPETPGEDDFAESAKRLLQVQEKARGLTRLAREGGGIAHEVTKELDTWNPLEEE